MDKLRHYASRRAAELGYPVVFLGLSCWLCIGLNRCAANDSGPEAA